MTRPQGHYKQYWCLDKLSHMTELEISSSYVKIKLYENLPSSSTLMLNYGIDT